MLLLKDTLYVGNTDRLMRYAYREGQTRLDATGEKILDLPAGDYNNHWTRNVVPRPDGTKLYVSVGSATNVDEEGIDAKDSRLLAILELNTDGTEMRVSVPFNGGRPAGPIQEFLTGFIANEQASELYGPTGRCRDASGRLTARR
jgi:glucose/arabinose dehydrogenase